MNDDAARGFLSRQRVAHLATASAAGQPHVVPVCFAVLDSSVYVAIDDKPKQVDPRRLKRVRNIAQNARVALVADLYDDRDWTRLGWVLVHGTARLLDPDQRAEEHRLAVAALRRKYTQYQTMALDGRPLIAITIDAISSWGHVEQDEALKAHTLDE